MCNISDSLFQLSDSFYDFFCETWKQLTQKASFVSCFDNAMNVDFNL